MNRNLSQSNRFYKILFTGFCIGIAAYLISIIWFNFNGTAFYIFDVYSDALVAKYMSEEATLFPENWVFGNQYYVAATPVVAALFYSIFHDTVLSLSIASCIMTLFILWSFIWCCKPFCKKQSIIVGVFSMIGAVVLGNGICTYKEGLQFLYTLASFYACYVICFLFTLGAYYRLKNGYPVSKLLLLLAVLLNIALGMQSPRELLVLNIPLVIVESLSVIYKKAKKIVPFYNLSSIFFVLITFCAELFGMWLVTLFEINTRHLISGLSLVSSFSELWIKIRIAFGNLAAINGLIFLRQGIKLLPLGLIALFIVFIMIFSSLRIAIKKDTSVSGQLFLISVLSVACVFGVGATVFTSESRYFFIRHVAAAFAFLYLAESFPEGMLKKLGLTALLLCGYVNLFYNVYPDLYKVNTLEELYTQIGDDLQEQNIDCVFVDWLTYPTVAACSDDEIKCMTFYPRFDCFKETGVLLDSVVYLRPLDIIENVNPSRSAIIIYDYFDIYMPSFFDQLNDDAPEGYYDTLMSHLSLEHIYEHEYMNVYVYTFDDASIIV